MIRLNVNTKGVQSSPELFVRHCKNAVGQLMELAEQEAKEMAPSKVLKGLSGGSGGITHNVKISGKKIKGILSATALNKETNFNYALAIHEGTGLYGPHKKVIRPKKSSVLVWLKDGSDNPKTKSGWKEAEKAGLVIRAKFTRGQKPNPFLKKGLQKVKQYGQRIFDREIEKFNTRFV
jgi:hypothetical protein